MHELSKHELYKALEYARSLDQDAGKKILTQFQSDQPILSQMIFGLFSASISEQNQEMSYLFMDLCFDVICVYQHAFGKTPTQSELSPEWLEKQASLLGGQLQAITKQKQVDKKAQATLQEHFAQQADSVVSQTGLIDFINDSIHDYASEDKTRIPAIKITETMILVMTHLLGSVYSHSKK